MLWVNVYIAHEDAFVYQRMHVKVNNIMVSRSAQYQHSLSPGPVNIREG